MDVKFHDYVRVKSGAGCSGGVHTKNHMASPVGERCPGSMEEGAGLRLA